MNSLYSCMLAVLVGLGLCGCGGSAPSAQQAPAEGAVLALDAWYVVASTDARALPVGSGLRLRAAGYDVSSGGRGQTMPGPCVLSSGAVDCAVPGAELRVAAREDGTLEATQGPLVLTLGPASAEQAAEFDATVAAHAAQTSACGAAARCCIAAEETLGAPCDINATLGDRTANSCEAALTRLREALTGDCTRSGARSTTRLCASRSKSLVSGRGAARLAP